jgi:hypothetical protein
MMRSSSPERAAIVDAHLDAQSPFDRFVTRTMVFALGLALGSLPVALLGFAGVGQLREGQVGQVPCRSP